MRKTMCVLFWLMVNVQPVFSGEIPEVLHIPNAGTPYPAWVAADRVLTPSGEVDPALFSVSDRFIISGALQQPPREGCIRWGHEQEVEEITVGSKKAVRQNLASTAKSAGWVFSATVTARATGFNSSVPGTLLEVVPEETFKGPRDRAGIHYVFFPVGTFSLGRVTICKTDERYPALPEVGERVLLFIDLFWRNEGRFLWTGYDTGIITITRNGEISLPKRYLKTEPWLAGGQEGDLLRFIRKSIEREN
jgi:hypothetical protein